MHGEFPADMLGCLGMPGQEVEDPVSFLGAAHGRDRSSQYRLLTPVVHPAVEDGSRVSPRFRDRPAGEGETGLADVLLSVSSVHAERVEFEELAGVVLVDPAALRRTGLLARRGEFPEPTGMSRPEGLTAGISCAGGRGSASAHPVVQIEEHRRGLGDGPEEIAEISQGAWADDVPLV